MNMLWLSVSRRNLIPSEFYLQGYQSSLSPLNKLDCTPVIPHDLKSSSLCHMLTCSNTLRFQIPVNDYKLLINSLSFISLIYKDDALSYQLFFSLFPYRISRSTCRVSDTINPGSYSGGYYQSSRCGFYFYMTQIIHPVSLPKI